MPKRKNKAAQSLGKLGHKATTEKYGTKAFAKGGKRGGAATLQKYGADHFKQMRQKALEKKRKEGDEK